MAEGPEIEVDVEGAWETDVETCADTSTTSGWQAPNSGSGGTSERQSEADDVPGVLADSEGDHTTANDPYRLFDSVNREEPMVFDEKEGGFVEKFPDPRAGAPINDNIACMPDMDAYLAAAGNLANPYHFATAELLWTTGLTGAGRDEHLKSHI
ncbi:hypothetical protein FRC06_011744, partial [Ceratobasidium sp. 370]